MLVGLLLLVVAGVWLGVDLLAADGASAAAPHQAQAAAYHACASGCYDLDADCQCDRWCDTTDSRYQSRLGCAYYPSASDPAGPASTSVDAAATDTSPQAESTPPPAIADGLSASSAPSSTPTPALRTRTRLRDFAAGRWWKICAVGQHEGSCLFNHQVLGVGEPGAPTVSLEEPFQRADDSGKIGFMWEITNTSHWGLDVMLIRSFYHPGDNFLHIGGIPTDIRVWEGEGVTGSHWVVTEHGSTEDGRTQFAIAAAVRYPGDHLQVGAQPSDLGMRPELESYWTIEEALPAQDGAMHGEFAWCADENGGGCTCDGTIRYGIGENWDYHVTNGVEAVTCNNDEFVDVARNQVKVCQCKGDGYSFATLEYGTVRCDGTMAFGAGGRFTFHHTAGVEDKACTSAAFGEDPAYGTIKACYCKPNTA